MTRQILTLMLLVMVMTGPLDVLAVFGIPEFLEFGDCTQVPLKDKFDPVKYSGLWFDIESVPNEYQHTKKCVTQNYTWTGDYMTVSTKGLTSEDKKVRQTAVMRVETSSVPAPNPAHMTVEAAGVPAAPYQIVSSDYRTYACVYSCLEYFGFRAEFFWVFGRTPTLPAEKIKLCHKIYEGLGINYKKMVPIVQGEPCPYNDKLPEMFHQNEERLLKVLGPYVPTSSITMPVPFTTQPTKTKEQLEIDQELKEIKELIQEEKKIVKQMESGAKSPKDKAAKTSQINREKEADLNSASPSSSSSTLFILFLSVFMAAFLYQ